MFPKTTWTHQHAVEKNHCSKLNELYWRCSRICVLCVTSILRKAVIYQTTKQRRKEDFSSMGRRLRGFVTDFKTGWSNWKNFLSPSPSFSSAAYCCLKMLFLQGNSRSMAVGRFCPRGVPGRWCEVLRRFSAESLTGVSSGEHLRTVGILFSLAIKQGLLSLWF